VTRAFPAHLPAREVNAAIIEGDSFHRYDRSAMRDTDGREELAGDHHFSHFGPEANLLAELEGPVPRIR
jgi:phosphoribulokinase